MTSVLEPLVIKGRVKNVTIPGRLILAPMAGVSDLPFRILCKEQGADLVCMEMISAKAITYGNRNTMELMRTVPEEAPVSLQLFGHEPGVMAEAIDILEHDDRVCFDLLDINMGCPVQKIVNNGEGSALMKDPQLIEKIVSAAVEHSSRPVTVKMRTGFTSDKLNVLDCAIAAEAGGASAVAVHGRTRPQMYSGAADLAKIAEVKAKLGISVFGNGDVRDGESALRMFNETGCDAVMIGRAAEGDPWVFARIREYLCKSENSGDVATLASAGESMQRLPGQQAYTVKVMPDHVSEEVLPSSQEVREMILRHAALQEQYKAPAIAMQEMRKHIAWYIKGFPGASKIRGEVNSIETMEDLRNLLDKYFKR